MLEKLKGWILGPLELVGVNLRGLIGFEIICRLLCVFVLFPILTWMKRLFLLFTGTTSITAKNSAAFFRNPMTWVILLAMALLISTFAMFERLAIVDTLHASKCGLKLSVNRIFRNGFDLTAERFRKFNIALIPYTMLVLHFSWFDDTSNVTSFIRIPGFLLEEFEKRPWKNVLYYAGVTILTYILIRWVFATIIMVEEDEKHFLRAAKKSFDMTGGTYFIHVLIVNVMWSAIAAALVIALSGLILAVWYLGSLWLIRGGTEPLAQFMANRIAPVGIAAYAGFIWVRSPILLAAQQTLYYSREGSCGEQMNPYTIEKDYIGTVSSVRFLLFAVIGVCVFFSGPRVFAQMRWIMNTNYGKPLIMAHRGYSAAAPENTIPAFEKAIEAGCTAVELDVQMTKDGVIVVMHDNNLKRVTGVNRNIWDATYEEVAALDAGSYFSSEYAGTTIPTLAEVLQRFSDDLFFNIEIKRTGHDDGIEQKTVDVIMEYGRMDNCDITSQDYATVEEVESINPGILTAYTSIIGIGSIEKLIAPDIISIQETFATYDNIDNLHSAGKRVFVWTVNREETMERLIALNVDAIITNDPVKCKAVMDEYSNNVVNIFKRLQNIFVYM